MPLDFLVSQIILFGHLKDIFGLSVWVLMSVRSDFKYIHKVPCKWWSLYFRSLPIQLLLSQFVWFLKSCLISAASPMCFFEGGLPQAIPDLLCVDIVSLQLDVGCIAQQTHMQAGNLVQHCSSLNPREFQLTGKRP